MDETRTPAFVLGVDCRPVDDERSPHAWYEYDIRSDFDAIAEAGLRRVRVFCSWRLMEPQVGQYDEALLARLDAVLAAATAAGLDVIVCLFTHDATSAPVEVPWASGRDPRADRYLMERAAAFARVIVERAREDSAVALWELGDTAFLAGFTTEAALESWTRALRSAIREVDDARPVQLGVDAETFLRATGVDARAAIDLCETATCLVPPAYRTFIADGPPLSRAGTHVDAFITHLALDALPVTVNDVGVPGLDLSLAEESAAVRTTLFAALMNGASGAMLRRWRDPATETRMPYRSDALETLGGICEADGTPKPVLGELQRFSAVTAALAGYTPVPARVAVMLPAERTQVLPSLTGIRTPRGCLRAFIAAKEAHLPVTVVREQERLAEARMLIVPGACTLATETWRTLAAFVQAGGFVLLSYGGGEADPALREVFGVEFLGDAGPRGVLSCRIAQPESLPGVASFSATVPVPHMARLSAGSASVVATDGDGSPLITARQYGQGRAVFVGAPLERVLAEADPAAPPAPVEALTRSLYAALAGAAGAAGTLTCDRPEVEIAHFTGEDDDLVLALNHAGAPVQATVGCPRAVAGVTDARGGETVAVDAAAFGVPLGRHGVAALRVTYRAERD